jgi:predicted nucleic acid-binding Zn ribbon protein
MSKGLCIVCGAETSRKNAKTCSPECKEKLKNIRLEERQKKRDRELLEELGEEEYIRLPKCAICGIRSNDLIPHITHWHKIKLNDYKEKYGSHLRSEKYLSEMSERAKGDKNPVHKLKDKQEISPFSYKFYMKKGFDEETSRQMALEKARKTQQDIPDNKKVTKLEYWLEKTGGDIKKAKKMLSERQTTFSKEVCIEKHGEEKGLEIWQERQDKWMETMDSKTEEETREINRKKGLAVDIVYLNEKYGHEKAKEIIKSRTSTQSYSKISQKLFSAIFENLGEEMKKECYFATLKNTGEIEDNGISDEYMVKTGNSIKFLDFYVKGKNKCIEFDGAYYHSEKFRKGKLKEDEVREEEIKESIDGIKILHISENDYRKNPEEVIKRCLEFIHE